MKLLLPPLAITTLIALAAEPPISQVGNLTATAILGWYAWHTATKAIPQLVQDFRGELATERAQQRDDREAYFRQIAEERVQRHADHAAIVEAVNELSAAIGSLNRTTTTNFVPASNSLSHER